MLVLTYEADRGSLRYRLWDMTGERTLLTGHLSGVGGMARHVYGYKHGSGNGTSHTANHRVAFERSVETLRIALPGLKRVEGAEGGIRAVGHLLGLPQPNSSMGVRVDDGLISSVSDHVERRPPEADSVGATLSIIENARRILAEIPQVAVFDDLASLATSREAVSYAVRSDVTSGKLISRLGPGGLRVRSVLDKALDMLGSTESTSRIVICDLDEVIQVSSFKGRSLIDTTHEFDGTSRLISAKAPGAVSPGLRGALATACGDEAKVDDLLARRSGLACIEDDPLSMADLASRAQDGKYGPANRMLFDQIIREIGGQLTLLGGMDALVFTGEAGLSSPALRAMITARLRIFKITLDDKRNGLIDGPTEVGGSKGRIRVLAIPGDSSWQVALEAARLADDGGQ